MDLCNGGIAVVVGATEGVRKPGENRGGVLDDKGDYIPLRTEKGKPRTWFEKQPSGAV